VESGGIAGGAVNRAAVGYALASAALFGASTPLAKLLLGELPPLLLAALLYLGSGIGLALWIVLRRLAGPAQRVAPIDRGDWPWLAAAILAGGVAGPALLMLGLARSDASAASLLLNLEAALTAGLAWVVFRENVDRRIFAGMLAIVGGGVLLSLTQAPRAGGVAGPPLVAALRELGTARSAAYISVAPFFGAALSLWLLGERPDAVFWAAAALMAVGVWLHVTERHAHEHVHEAAQHEHPHRHDAHHRHGH